MHPQERLRKVMNSKMKGFPFDSFPKQHPQARFPIFRSNFSKERILKEKA